MRDYYAILGVTPQAEDVVIKAAFRALAQRYHPDKYSGSAEEAQRKMAEINEAYGVLSDPVKRKAYDAEYQSSGMGESDFDAGDAAANEGVQQFSQDWETAVEYYPDLTTLAMTLEKTSKSLAFIFRLYMITEKAFKNRRQVAEVMHNAFLTRYFGDQKAVLAFAKTLIAIGRKDAAKALNEAVRVLGDDIDPTLVINKIKDRFGLFEEPRQSQNSRSHKRPPYAIDAGIEDSMAARLSMRASRADATIYDVRDAIEALQGTVSLGAPTCSISVFGMNELFATRDDAVVWFRTQFFPRLYFSSV
jgi:curved DNA-binding protein CbpA